MSLPRCDFPGCNGVAYANPKNPSENMRKAGNWCCFNHLQHNLIRNGGVPYCTQRWSTGSCPAESIRGGADDAKCKYHLD